MKSVIKSALRWLTLLPKIFYRWLIMVMYVVSVKKIRSIPIVINNFNRLTYPRQLIQFLERCGLMNIIILDNNSTYEPLLDYYENCKYTIIKCSNLGHLALWKSGLYNKIKWNYFIYTDSDVVPIEECPEAFLVTFKKRLDSSIFLEKVGFGIRIDDLPDSFSLKSKVVQYESLYWKNEVKPNIYEAPIDTTFALYKPLSNLIYGHAFTQKANRFGFPYLIRHLPWYVDSENLTEEEKQNVISSNASSSLAEQFKGHKIIY